MITINSPHGHQSINQFENITLEDFSIIVGINGAGKTHLLQGLVEGSITAHGIPVQNIQYFNYGDFKFNVDHNGKPLTHQNSRFPSLRKTKLKVIERFLKTSPFDGQYEWLGTCILMYLDLTDFWQTEDFSFFAHYSSSSGEYLDSTDLEISQKLKNHIINYKNSIQNNSSEEDPSFYQNIINEKFKKFNEFYASQRLGDVQIIESECLVDNIFLIKKEQVFGFDLLLDKLKKAEKQYQIRKDELKHEYRERLLEEEDDIRVAKGALKSMDSLLSPVDEVNLVLAEYDIKGFRLEASELRLIPGKSADHTDISITITSEKIKRPVSVEALSTGEKILMALSVLVNQSRENEIQTELLLLDEIDSFLHPEMIIQFNKVLKESFLDKGIKIIMTTHSPTTVALCDENSLFLMKDGNLSRANHSETLRHLTVGVPSLVIDPKNRKQVFVESDNDVYFYESIYNIVKTDLCQEIHLHFIGSGKSKKSGDSGNCAQVIELVSKLVDNGNNRVYGIIDFDNNEKRENSESIHIMGYGKRYSIENYLLDPLYIGLILIISGEWEKLFPANEYTILQLRDFSQDDLQSIHDLVLGYIKSEIDKHQLDLINRSKLNCEKVKQFNERNLLELNSKLKHDERFDTTLKNGFNIKTSKALSCYKGHCYEALVIDIFRILERIKNTNNGLKNSIINRVFNLLPSVIPNDFIYTFQNIQGHKP